MTTTTPLYPRITAEEICALTEDQQAPYLEAISKLGISPSAVVSMTYWLTDEDDLDHPIHESYCSAEVQPGMSIIPMTIEVLAPKWAAA